MSIVPKEINVGPSSAIASAAFLAPAIVSGIATRIPGARVPAAPATKPKIPRTPTIPSMA